MGFRDGEMHDLQVVPERRPRQQFPWQVDRVSDLFRLRPGLVYIWAGKAGVRRIIVTGSDPPSERYSGTVADLIITSHMARAART